MDFNRLNLYFENANKTGYTIMSECDFVILPRKVYFDLLKVNEVHKILNDYRNKLN